MPLLPHALRSDITRATFHAQEGDPALVPAIAERIHAALAGLDPADAPALAGEIAAALHQPALPQRRTATGLAALWNARRNARIAALEAQVAAVRARAAADPALAPLFACAPDTCAAALAALPEPPSPVHAALAAHARGDRRCTSA